jgi:hypothetical protein
MFASVWHILVSKDESIIKKTGLDKQQKGEKWGKWQTEGKNSYFIK